MVRTDYLAFDSFLENSDDEEFEQWYSNATPAQRQRADMIREEIEEEELEEEVSQVERRQSVIERIRRFFRFGR